MARLVTSFDHHFHSILTMAILLGIGFKRCWKVMRVIWRHTWWVPLSICVRFDSCWVSCQIALSTSSQKCSFGLISGDCGGQLQYSWNQSCIIQSLKGYTHANGVLVFRQILTLPSVWCIWKRNSLDPKIFFYARLTNSYIPLRIGCVFSC